MKFARWFMFVLLAASPAVAQTHYVAASGTATPPYTNWHTAAHTIQAACDVATDGAMILVTNGTFVLTAPIVITNGVTVRGFRGAEVTIVDGNNAFRCFRLRHTNAVLENLTITRGYTNTGAGVHLDAGTVRGCTVIANRTHAPAFGLWGMGGGVYLTTGCVVEACTIFSNFAHFGGGAYCAGGGTVRDSFIGDNDAENGVSRDGVFGAVGGGVCCDGGGTVQRCTITNNWAQFYGGGVYASGTSRVERCVIDNNRVNPGASENPRVDPRAGGVYLNGSVLENCLVRGNQAAFEGAGVWSSGGGVVQSCTIVTNNSLYYGSQGCGLYVTGGSTIYNSIIVLNGGNTNQPNYNTNATTISYSCTTPLPIAGTGNITNAPLFLSAVSNDFHLLQGSPGIDAGGTNGAPAVDLDGVARPLDGNTNGAAAFDMGAYEFAHPGADTDDDGQSDAAEVIAGTDARDPQDNFQVTGSPEGAGVRYILNWQGASNRVYAILTTRDLRGSWEPIDGQEFLRGTDGTMSFTNIAPSTGIEYYRVRVTR